ncbi:hypothetical protein BDR03DRAFT_967299 [Suillus americanus]|nr:hypothetical protein BDR03DRAFT_967299 [Suillus americanus]
MLTASVVEIVGTLTACCPLQETNRVRVYARHTQNVHHSISYSSVAHTEIEKGHQGPALPLP